MHLVHDVPIFLTVAVFTWASWGEGLNGTGAVLISPLSLSLCTSCMPSPHQHRHHFTKELARTSMISSHQGTNRTFWIPFFNHLRPIHFLNGFTKSCNIPHWRFSFPLWPPNSPKISQAGDLGVVADSIHVNLKHAHSSMVHSCLCTLRYGVHLSMVLKTALKTGEASPHLEGENICQRFRLASWYITVVIHFDKGCFFTFLKQSFCELSEYLKYELRSWILTVNTSAQFRISEVFIPVACLGFS